VVGIGLLRGSWGRRRTLKNRIADLEQQNTELRSRERLQEVVDATQSKHFVELPDSELTAEPGPEPEPQPSTAPTPSEEIGASS